MALEQLLETQLVIAGAQFAGAANYAVKLLQACHKFHNLIVAQTREVLAEISPHNAVGSFGQLHASRGWRRDMFAPVLGIGLTYQQAFLGQKLNLAADASFGLTQAVGNGFLLDPGIPFQHHKNLELAETYTKLLLQNLVGLFAHNSSQMVQKVAEIISGSHNVSLFL